jgi:hypothetical protein
LKIIDGRASAPPGTEWNEGALQIMNSDIVLDGVFVKGSVDYYGKGKLTIRNSIIEGNRYRQAAMTGRSGHLDISDTTLKYKVGEQIPNWPWGNGAIHGDSTMMIVRCDISGYPTGVQNGPGNSTFEQNYIHDVQRLGTYPDNVHNDGIFNYGGRGLVIRYNRIDISGPNGLAYDGTHQTGAILIQPDNSTPSIAPQIYGNYLMGGGYTLRLEEPMRDAVVYGNRFGPTTGGWGEALRENDVTIARWEDNLSATGKVVGRP